MPTPLELASDHPARNHATRRRESQDPNGLRAGKQLHLPSYEHSLEAIYNHRVTNRTRH